MRGYQDFADRWNPILDVFDEVGVRFAHEVHPSEIAYDYWTTVRTLEAIGHRPAFGLNWDPSHFVWQDLDPVGFLWDFQDRIYHVDCKDVEQAARQRAQRPARLAPAVGRPAPRLGLRLDRSRRRAVGGRASGCSTPSATRARSRSSGRTPGWTARRRPGGPRIRPGADRDRAAAGRIRRGVLIEWLKQAGGTSALRKGRQ